MENEKTGYAWADIDVVLLKVQRIIITWAANCAPCPEYDNRWADTVAMWPLYRNRGFDIKLDEKPAF